MNELQHLISLVKTSKEPVQTIVDTYFNSVTWSLLKSEYNRFTKAQKAKFITKLTAERK